MKLSTCISCLSSIIVGFAIISSDSILLVCGSVLGSAGLICCSIELATQNIINKATKEE